MKCLFVSGGSEGVLVFWNIETNEKQFIPGLGAGIKYISLNEDSSQLCVGLKTNRLAIIDIPSKSIITCFNGLYTSDESFHVKIDPSSGSIVYPSKPGYLQFYNKGIINEVEIVKQNEICSHKQDLFKVKAVDFSYDGKFMATIGFIQQRSICKILGFK